jgi:hypothetical protein
MRMRGLGDPLLVVSDGRAFPSVRFDDQVDSTSQALAADHSTYNAAALAEGMARFSAALTFDPFIRSLYDSKFG